MTSTSLTATHAGQLVAHKTFLVSAQLSDTVESVLGKMLLHDILAVPLKNESDQFVGIISIHDIVLDLVFRPEENALLARSLSRQIREVFALREEARHLWVLTPSENLGDIIRTFASGVHRALVPQKDETNHWRHVMLTQTDVIRFLHSHLESFSELKNKTLADLKLGKKHVDTIHADMRTFDAYKLLGDTYVTALPIIEKETDRILGNLSASDLRGLTLPKLRYLNETVETFLSAQHGGVRKPVTTTESESLREVMDKMLFNKVHRVWLVDEQQRPMGIVTMSDILGAFQLAA